MSLLSALVLVRCLGVERFGIWSVLNSVVGLYPILELGLTTAATYRLACDVGRSDWRAAGRDLGTSFVLITFVGLAVGAAMWIGSSFLTRFLFSGAAYGDEIGAALKVLSVLVVARCWQAWAGAAEAARLDYGRQTFVETAAASVSQLGIIALAAWGYGMQALALWLLLVTVAADTGHFLVLRRLWTYKEIRIDKSREAIGAFVSLGLSNWLSNIGSVLFGQVDRILVNLSLGPAAAGIYSAATSIAGKINEVAALPLRVVSPAVSAALAAGDMERVRGIFLKATRVNGVISFALVSAVLFGSQPLSGLLVNSEAAPVLVSVLQVLAVVYGLFVLNVAPYWVAIGLGKPGVNARWGIAGGVLTCLLLALLCARFQVYGAAWANAGYLITLFINVEIAGRAGVRRAEYLNAVAPAAIGIVALPVSMAAVAPAALAAKVPVLAALHFIIGFAALGPGLRQEIAQTARHAFGAVQTGIEPAEQR